MDAVYVPLPVSEHTEWTVKALEAGKHVLCEKPFVTSAAEAAGRRCAEGLMWRHHPQTALARKLVADGAIGRLAFVRAALSVSVPAGDIRRSVELGGGRRRPRPRRPRARRLPDRARHRLGGNRRRRRAPFGRADAVAQADALEALHRSAELATPVAPAR